jgi:hypothetical protein
MLVVLLADADQGLAAQFRDTEVTGGKRATPAALKVADDDGGLPGVAVVAACVHCCLENRFSRSQLLVHCLVFSINSLGLHVLCLSLIDRRSQYAYTKA